MSVVCDLSRVRISIDEGNREKSRCCAIRDAVGLNSENAAMDGKAGRPAGWLAAILSHPKVEQPVSTTAWLCQITKVSKGAKASRGNTRETGEVKQAAGYTKRMYV